MRPADPAPTTTTSVSAYVIMSVMYRRVISRDTIDSLMGSNLNDPRSYAGDWAAADTELDDLRCWTRDGDEIGAPKRDDDGGWESRKEDLDLGLGKREGVKVAAIVAIGERERDCVVWERDLE